MVEGDGVLIERYRNVQNKIQLRFSTILAIKNRKLSKYFVRYLLTFWHLLEILVVDGDGVFIKPMQNVQKKLVLRFLESNCERQLYFTVKVNYFSCQTSIDTDFFSSYFDSQLFFSDLHLCFVTNFGATFMIRHNFLVLVWMVF